MKNVIVVFVLLLFGVITTVNAQEKGKFRVGLDLGYTVPMSGGGGLLFYLEPKYNIQDNMNIGLRIGGAAMVRDLVYFSNTDDATGKVSVNGSYVLTYDYYFKSEGSNFAPFVGAGLGWMTFASVEVDTTNDPDDYGGLSANTAFAPVLRAGFEAGKFRLSLDYNLVPKSDLVNSQGTVIGETGNSYLGVALGFYVGGGKWRN
ncbi:OmpW family outer membrane protein [Aquiflexum lacus]|uniref:OmpW family outer membrane protein n=1 Tax=Aquiflexum lacus TaxID=2483805 RepID=UPI001893B299|nr:OmpW family outer membrane protein [Aquiflexum lacus]